MREAIRETGKLELLEVEEEETFVIRGKEWEDIKTLEEGLNHIAELLKPGDRIGVYSFRSYAIAYIDLSDFRDEDLIRQGDSPSVSLRLPAIQIESIGRSTTVNVLHERVSGSKGKITPKEKKILQDKASMHFRKSVAPGGALHGEMVRKAQAKATAFFRGLLAQGGLRLEKVTFGDGEEVPHD